MIDTPARAPDLKLLWQVAQKWNNFIPGLKVMSTFIILEIWLRRTSNLKKVSNMIMA